MAKLTSFGFRIAALIFSILYAAALPFAWTWAPGLRGPSLNGRVTVTAHSGCMRQPENTVRSMEAGVAAGADIVEFDLNFDENGPPVLSHNAPGDSECTPLADAFAFLAMHPCVKANVDVKSAAFIEKVQPMAEDAGVLEQIFFTGLFEHDIPDAARACPDVPYYLNVSLTGDEDPEALAEKTAALGAVGVNLYHGDVSPELVSAMHEKGLLVSVWTIDNPKDAARALRTGADNVTTNKPVLLRLMAPRIFLPKKFNGTQHFY